MLLLMKDHTVKRKKDRKITKKDLDESQYIMIDTATELSKLSKNYVIIDPKNIPWFTSANVTYQMLFLYDDHEMGSSQFEPIPPVETKVTSLSDLINLINCIDRLYIPNQMISNDQYYYTDVYIIIGYFEVTLYDESKKVYHKVYQNNDNLENRYGEAVKFPLKAVKKFHDIYNTDIIRNLTIYNQFLYIHKDMTWDISAISTDYSLMGIPLLGSYTITLLDKREYLSISCIFGMSVSYSLVFVYDKKEQERISALIRAKEYDEVSEYNYEYILTSNLEYGRQYSYPYRFIYLDILSHIGFSIRLTNMIYFYIEGYEVEGVRKEEDIDTIACITMYNMVKNKKIGGGDKTIFMNEDTLIPLDDLLKII